MSNKTRKRFSPTLLVMSLAVVGVLAAFIALAAQPGTSEAHGPDDHTSAGLPACADMTDGQKAIHDRVHEEFGQDGCPDDPVIDPPTPDTPAGTMLKSSSDSGGAGIMLALTIKAADMEDLVAGDRIEIYLEDDYSVPDSISTSDVYFRVPGGGVGQNNGGRVNAADVSIDDDDHFTADKDDLAIAILVPDMDPRDDEFGYPVANRDLVVVIEKDAGIKNPTEEGTHSNGYSILTGSEPDNAGPEVTLAVLNTWAKISLSASDGGRGKEVTVIGSGFNNGTSAEVFVLVAAAVDATATPPVEAPSCATVVSDGASLGTANVGGNDKFTVVFTVHQDEFNAGQVNYICAKDDESDGGNRYASAVKPFKLTDSLTIAPDAASPGDEVTLKPRDFVSDNLVSVNLGGKVTLDCCDRGDPVQEDGSDYVFDMPGGLPSGTLRITVEYDDDANATASITVDPSSLELSSTEVVPNETIIISGSGFSEDAEICVGDIKIDGKALKVDDAGTSEDNDDDIACDDKGDRYVSTTSNGDFTATVRIWSEDPETNPALDDDEYTIRVEDVNMFVGKAKVTILEPTITINPMVASPRDYITISGANWPASNSDDDHEVRIEVEDKNRSANIDSTGRFNLQYQLSGNIGIGKEHDVTVTFTGTVGNIEEEGTFAVPSSNVTITPAAAAPGEMISLEITGMPIYERVGRVVIDGGNRLGGTAVNTDVEGNVMITGIVVPYADPGFYPVQIDVGNETAIVQLEILAEPRAAGVAAALPGAVEDLGDSVVRIFHFNTSSKVWTFYDPRPEFEGLNTLTELANGQPYWILVSETVENVVLNGKTRNLTCVGGDCWNQLVW